MIDWITSRSSALYAGRSVRDGVQTKINVNRSRSSGDSVPERIERANPLGNSLGVVDAVDANAELSRALARTGRAASRRARAVGRRRHCSKRSTSMLIGNAPTLHGAIAKGHRLPRVIDVRLGHELVDAIEKIRGVAIDLELDQIVAEQSAEHRFVDPDRQQAKDVGRRKRECARTDE